MKKRQTTQAANTPGVRRKILIRIRLVFLFFLVLTLGVAARIYYLQQVQGEEILALANHVTEKKEEVPGTRGNIYADDGASLLATSVPSYRMVLDGFVLSQAKKELKVSKRIDSLSYLLSAYFADDAPAEYRAKIMSSVKERKRYTVLNSRLVDFQTRKKMLQWPLLKLGRNKGGVYFEKEERREKPFKHLASRLIGYINKSNEGAGIEYSFNDTLMGTPGMAWFQYLGRGIKKTLSVERKPVDGLDIVTTIDINLQDVAESALENELRRNGAESGCAILMEVKTGEIKAMANLGRIPNTEELIYIEDDNYAMRERKEPGSTFKLASYLALLEAKKIKLTDSVFCEWGSITWGKKVMTDSKPGGYGWLSIVDAFAYSSNVGVSKLIHKHFKDKPDEFIGFMDRFGLTSNLQLQLSGSPTTHIPRPKKKGWSGNSLTSMSIGYGVELTPLQTLAFYNAVANNGTMVAPRVVKQIRRDDEVVKEYGTKVLIPSIASSRALNQVRQMLEAVVDHGTAKNIKQSEYKIAGKTGTAQKLIDGKYTKRYYASFAGYFPAEAPKYSCIVIIDNPEQPLYGADVAAPVFKELASKIYARDTAMHKDLSREKQKPTDRLPGMVEQMAKGYHDDLATVCRKLGISEHGSGTLTNSIVRGVAQPRNVRWERVAIRKQAVPDVTHMSLRDAMPLLENNGYVVRYQGSGKVKTQTPEPGTQLAKGGVVFLQLHKRLPAVNIIDTSSAEDAVPTPDAVTLEE